MKKPNLKKLAKKWAFRVGVADWHITARYCKPSELTVRSDYAKVDFNHSHRRATVLVKHPKHKGASVKHVEWAVVHELLHVALAPFCSDLENGSIAQNREEQLINRLAETLTKRNP